MTTLFWVSTGLDAVLLVIIYVLMCRVEVLESQVRRLQ